MSNGSTLTRRSLLTGSTGLAALVLLAACTDAEDSAAISPDQAALNTALAGENALIVAFTPGVDGTPTEQRRGEAALRSHRAHADALIAAGATDTDPTPPATTPAPAQAKPPRELVRLQRAQADRLERLALGVSPRVALLLGSVAASDSATAVLLGAGR